jgi:CheY-like chemotaxis protein
LSIISFPTSKNYNYKHIWHGLLCRDTNGMRLLIGENEKSIARTYTKILKKRNHKVRIADNGEDCLKVYRRSQKLTLTTGPSMRDKPFDAVILNYKMAKMNGIQVAKEILAINPNQRIILTSCNVEYTSKDSAQLKQFIELLQKPFTKQALIETIEKHKAIYDELHKLNVNVNDIRAANFRYDQLREILQILKDYRKGHCY